jgi:hypothetical protein
MGFLNSIIYFTTESFWGNAVLFKILVFFLVLGIFIIFSIPSKHTYLLQKISIWLGIKLFILSFFFCYLKSDHYSSLSLESFFTGNSKVLILCDNISITLIVLTTVTAIVPATANRGNI